MPASPNWQAIEDLICRDLARCIPSHKNIGQTKASAPPYTAISTQTSNTSASPTCLWQPHPYPVKHGFTRLKTASVKYLKAMDPRFATGRNGFPRFQDRLSPSLKTALARVIKNTLNTQNISGSLKTDSRFSGCLIEKNKYARNHLHAAGGSRSAAAPLHSLHRSRPSQQTATVAGGCHACCYRHLVYLFRQPQRTDKAGHPTAAGCRHHCLYSSFAILRSLKHA